MLTRKLLKAGAGLSVALLFGLATRQVAAAEPVSTAASSTIEQSEFRANLAEYLKSVDHEVKVKLDGKLEQIEPVQAPVIYLASAETRVRV